MNEDAPHELDELWCEAKSHISRGRFDEAIEIYKYVTIRYMDDDAAVEQAHAYLGDILPMLGRIDEGEYHIRRALSYDLENHHYHSLLGFIYYVRYEWESAMQEYRLALDREPWNREYVRALAVAMFNSGDKKKGLEYLHEVAPLYPNNSGMLTELATAYMSVGDMFSARQYAEEAVRANPTDVMAHAVLMKIKQGEPLR